MRNLGLRLRHGALFIALMLPGLCVLSTAGLAETSPYSKRVLEKDAPRLRNAVRKIYDLGIKPFLSAEERAGIGSFAFEFPMPRAGDDPLNVYASYGNAKTLLIMPVLSLKTLEDLTTAYAWAYVNNKSLSTIDLYFAMARYQGRKALKDNKLRPILDALGVPTNANSDAKVDALSLGLRNEAFAFLMAHELGHIRYRHAGLDRISKTRARADERQADRFALAVLARTKTPPLGAVLLFQALLYSDPHKGEFKTAAAWQDYLAKTSTHPLTVDRLRAMADMIGGPLARSVGKSGGLWRDIALKLRQIITIMEDVELQRCVAKLASKADYKILLPRKDVAKAQLMRSCAGP